MELAHQNNSKSSNHAIAQSVLMIEPVSFGFNPQTAVNNFFQKKPDLSSENLQINALQEYLVMVEQLRSKGIEVISIQDTLLPHTPDSIFPNNWISFHEEGQVVMYPMFAPNRRLERRQEILHMIEQSGHLLSNVDDFSFWEEENIFLEGTGSMILDRVNKIAYAAISERTDKSLFLQYCSVFGYYPVSFTANHTVGKERKAVYHTNVMLCIADRYAIVCAGCLDDPAERENLLNSLQASGKQLIEISENQMHHFAGNMLQLGNRAGEKFLVMSQSAYDVLADNQRSALKSYNDFIICNITTIEKAGGGSVRCMMAEVF